jgi:hypothetical protein
MRLELCGDYIIHNPHFCNMGERNCHILVYLSPIWFENSNPHLVLVCGQFISTDLNYINLGYQKLITVSKQWNKQINTTFGLHTMQRLYIACMKNIFVCDNSLLLIIHYMLFTYKTYLHLTWSKRRIHVGTKMLMANFKLVNVFSDCGPPSKVGGHRSVLHYNYPTCTTIYGWMSDQDQALAHFRNDLTLTITCNWTPLEEWVINNHMWLILVGYQTLAHFTDHPLRPLPIGQSQQVHSWFAKLDPYVHSKLHNVMLCNNQSARDVKEFRSAIWNNT